MASAEALVVGHADTLRCALRVSPLREPEMEGVDETDAHALAET